MNRKFIVANLFYCLIAKFIVKFILAKLPYCFSTAI